MSPVGTERTYQQLRSMSAYAVKPTQSGHAAASESGSVPGGFKDYFSARPVVLSGRLGVSSVDRSVAVRS